MKKIIVLFLLSLFVKNYLSVFTSSCLNYYFDGDLLVVSNSCNHEITYRTFFKPDRKVSYGEVHVDDKVILFDEKENGSQFILESSLSAFKKTSYNVSSWFLSGHGCKSLSGSFFVYEVEKKDLVHVSNTLWFGDSLMSSLTDKSFADYFNEFTYANYQDLSFSGSVISPRVKILSGYLDHPYYILDVIDKTIGDINFIPEVIFLNGGVNDIIGYDRDFYVSLMDDVTYLLDEFEKTLRQVKLVFPKVQLIYVNLFNYHVMGLINYISKVHPNLNDIVKSTSFIFLRERSLAYFSGVEKLMKKYGFTYVDLSFYLGDDSLMNDSLHLNQKGYVLLLPHILESIKKQPL